MFFQRIFLLIFTFLLLIKCHTTSNKLLKHNLNKVNTKNFNYKKISAQYISLYKEIRNEKFFIPAVNLNKLNHIFLRKKVQYYSSEVKGTIIIDTLNRYLYFILDNNHAMRYGIGIGREGFMWKGQGIIAYKKKWPVWTPPNEMTIRQPETAQWKITGMPPGIDNPLGARALYIFSNNKDTLYRIHGTSEVTSIGKAVTSGCIRLLQQDVIDLYNRVQGNNKIIVI